MNNLDLINKLPDSIYAIDQNSNNYKLWELFAGQMDELDELFSVIKLVNDVRGNSGATLDMLGKILRSARRGWGDQEYMKYLLVAIRKYQCDGSIEDLIEICTILLDDDFKYIRDLNEPDLEGAIYLDGSFYLDETVYLSGYQDNPDAIYLDGSYWLDGSWYLSCDICQPRFFEVVVADSLADNMVQLISDIIKSCKGGGIKYKIRKIGG